MLIEKETKNLSESIEFNSLGENKKKRQIILAETKRNHRDYINSLRYRYNKKNPYLPNYVINKDGEIFKIMTPDKYSKFMCNEIVDKYSIIICMENYGWLKKNPLENSYVNWIGDIYKQKVYEKKWRDSFFWDPYGEEQMKSLSKLIIELCDEFKIPKTCLGNNVKQDGVENFKGVVSKSNFDFSNKDVNPSFDFKLLQELIKL
jgi:N-acetyl-anhydromuramyl-L-alanine amidase AmpD